MLCPTTPSVGYNCYSLTKEHPWAEHLTNLSKKGVGTLLNVATLTTKEHPWAEHLTNLSKKGVGTLLNVAALTTKEHPCHVTVT